MAAKTDAAGRRVGKKGEAPKAALVDKDITPVMKSFVEYIKEQTGYDADPRSVQLGGVLRGEFQKSDTNQKRIADRKAERVQEAIDLAARKEARIKAREERAAEREERKAAREAAAAEKAAAPKPEKTTSARSTKATPTKPTTRSAPAAKTSGKASIATARRRPARAAAAKGDDSDF